MSVCVPSHVLSLSRDYSRARAHDLVNVFQAIPIVIVRVVLLLFRGDCLARLRASETEEVERASRAVDLDRPIHRCTGGGCLDKRRHRSYRITCQNRCYRTPHSYSRPGECKYHDRRAGHLNTLECLRQIRSRRRKRRSDEERST